MNAPTIALVSFGLYEKSFLEKISDAVEHEFNCTSFFKDVHIDISEFYDPVRRQYNGDKLLKAIDCIHIPGATKAIGLFNVDLYIPILTYIYGQAQLGGRTAIASQYRLSNERYGLPKNEALLLERFVKEIIHELGHTFGLIHCHTPTCVMRSSTYVEDIDQKDAQLCMKCRNEI